MAAPCKCPCSAANQPALGATFDLFDSPGVNVGFFNNGITFDQPGYAGAMNYATGVLTITSVPEPGTATILLAGLATLACRRRKRNVRA